MAFHSWKDGAFLADGTTMKAVSGGLTETTEKIDVTNTASSGNAEFIPGVTQGDVNLVLLWEDDNQPTSTPPSLSTGSQTSVTCTLASGNSYSGTLQIESLSYSFAVRAQAITYTLSGSFTGTYTKPG